MERPKPSKVYLLKSRRSSGGHGALDSRWVLVRDTWRLVLFQAGHACPRVVCRCRKLAVQRILGSSMFTSPPLNHSPCSLARAPYDSIGDYKQLMWHGHCKAYFAPCGRTWRPAGLCHLPLHYMRGLFMSHRVWKCLGCFVHGFGTCVYRTKPTVFGLGLGWIGDQECLGLGPGMQMHRREIPWLTCWTGLGAWAPTVPRLWAVPRRLVSWCRSSRQAGNWLGVWGEKQKRCESRASRSRTSPILTGTSKPRVSLP